MTMVVRLLGVTIALWSLTTVYHMVVHTHWVLILVGVTAIAQLLAVWWALYLTDRERIDAIEAAEDAYQFWYPGNKEKRE